MGSIVFVRIQAEEDAWATFSYSFIGVPLVDDYLLVHLAYALYFTWGFFGK